MKKKAILSVSFGTNDAETSKKNLDVLEEEYSADHPGLPIYRALTNDAVIELMHQKDGNAPIYAVREAIARMLLDGVTHLYVQPSYILNGTEYDELREMIFSHKADFVKVACGAPLLTSEEDLKRTCEAIAADFGDLAEDEAVLAVGHGSHHYSNAIYCALDYTARDLGKKLYLATFNAFPKIEHATKLLKADGIKKVKLVPFMFVAGSAAMEGVCGSAKDSMAERLKAEGFHVEAVRKCLGEYKGIREIYRRHLSDLFE